jgi:hypothetical protein
MLTAIVMQSSETVVMIVRVEREEVAENWGGW